MVPTMIEDIHALEQRLLDPSVRSDAVALSALLAPDFVEFGASGQRYERNEILQHLARESREAGLALSDFEVIELAPQVVLARFRITKQVAPEARVVESLRSSIWRNTGGRWQLLFHQGSPIQGIDSLTRDDGEMYRDLDQRGTG